MKKIIFVSFIFVFCSVILAQNFEVIKMTGKVQILHGTEENFRTVRIGDTVSGSDLVETYPNSFIQLKSANGTFILRENSALGINHIKAISINELLLALAMEEIRNIPVKENNSDAKNTAVYGENITNKRLIANESNIGDKLLNGAMQLAKSGYNESAVIAANEIYRNYPTTRHDFKSRIFFTDILIKLNLFEEALTNLNKIDKSKVNKNNSEIITEKYDEIISEMAK